MRESWTFYLNQFCINTTGNLRTKSTVSTNCLLPVSISATFPPMAYEWSFQSSRCLSSSYRFARSKNWSGRGNSQSIACFVFSDWTWRSKLGLLTVTAETIRMQTVGKNYRGWNGPEGASMSPIRRNLTSFALPSSSSLAGSIPQRRMWPSIEETAKTEICVQNMPMT